MYGRQVHDRKDWGYFSYELLLLCSALKPLKFSGSLCHFVSDQFARTWFEVEADIRDVVAPGRHLLREGPALDQVAALIPICRVRQGLRNPSEIPVSTTMSHFVSRFGHQYSASSPYRGAFSTRQ